MSSIVNSTVRISTGNDDVEQEEISGAMYRTSTDLEITEDSAFVGDDQYIGMRFQNVQVPQGSKITNASIEFIVDETTSTGGVVTIRGDDVDNSSAFTSTAYNVSNRAFTTAAVSWTLPTVGSVGNKKYTSNISSIIQEIVDRSGWVSGNSISIIIEPNSTVRTYESYNGVPASAPLLDVNYGVFDYEVLGNHTEGGNFTWNISGLPDQTDIDLRCRAIDPNGSNTFSNYYNPYINLTISGPFILVDKTQYRNCDSQVYYEVKFYDDNGSSIDDDSTFSIVNSSGSELNSTSGTSSGGVYQGTFVLFNNYNFGNWALRSNTGCYIDEGFFLVSEYAVSDIWKIDILFDPNKVIYTIGDFINMSFQVWDLKGEPVPGLSSNISADVNGNALSLVDIGNGWYSDVFNTTGLSTGQSYTSSVLAYKSLNNNVTNSRSFYLQS